jgi:putative restriction endonuclease
MTRAWSLITLGADRQYAGNRGYQDDLRTVYRYDSNVANSRNVSRGDLALIRDRNHLLGVARIQRVSERPSTKTMLRCPVCRAVDLKQRAKKAPKFRCGNRHEFERPIEDVAKVMEFAAHYGGTYVEAPDALPVSAIKAAAPRPSDQLSIEEIDLSRLERSLMAKYPSTRELITAFVQGKTLGSHDAAPDHGIPLTDPYAPSISDSRDSILRSIKVRRGQQKFRNALLKRYGPCCLITGCSLLDIVEAAHIWPHRGEKDNHPENGLLLRADIHTLFDLDMLGVRPDSLEINVAPPLQEIAEYAQLGNRRLQITNTRPSRAALSHRWAAFETRWRSDVSESCAS